MEAVLAQAAQEWQWEQGSGFYRRRHASVKNKSHISGSGSKLLPAELQRQMEEMVTTDMHLQGQAVIGFQSAIRAYSAHAKESRHIFQPRLLHFGHFARSFALKEPPSSLAAFKQV